MSANATNPHLFVFHINPAGCALWHKPDMDGSCSGYEHRASHYQQWLSGLARRFAIPSCLILIDVEDEARPATPVPIFSFQREHGQQTILLPDMECLEADFYAESPPDALPFVDKAPDAMFVGSTSGGHITHDALNRNAVPRIRLARFAKAHPEIIVRLPVITQCADESVVQRLVLEGYGGNRILWRDQTIHRFMISIDGNGAACSRLYLSLMSNCAVIRYRSPNELFFFRGLAAGKHYIGVDRDEDLLDVLSGDQMRHAEVAAEGRRFAETYLQRAAIENYGANLLRVYAGLFSPA